jgi:hypothetical protein
VPCQHQPEPVNVDCGWARLVGSDFCHHSFERVLHPFAFCVQSHDMLYKMSRDILYSPLVANPIATECRENEDVRFS